MQHNEIPCMHVIIIRHNETMLPLLVTQSPCYLIVPAKWWDHGKPEDATSFDSQPTVWLTVSSSYSLAWNFSFDLDWRPSHGSCQSVYTHMSFQGRMTQERFVVPPRFLSVSVDVDPFIKKCWFAVVLQSLLFRSCRQIDDSSVCWISRLSSRRRSFFRTIATLGWFWPVDWH